MHRLRDSIATALEWHATPLETRESVSWLVRSVEGSFAMYRIIQANIDRLKLLLETETDPTKRAMEIRLLAEEEAKQVPTPEKNEA